MLEERGMLEVEDSKAERWKQAGHVALRQSSDDKIRSGDTQMP
jgi:hypothetical protein